MYTTGDEYIRVPRGQETSTCIRQETSTYECLEVRRRVHVYDSRRVHTSAQRSGDEYIRVEISPRN